MSSADDTEVKLTAAAELEEWPIVAGYTEFTEAQLEARRALAAHRDDHTTETIREYPASGLYLRGTAPARIYSYVPTRDPGPDGFCDQSEAATVILVRTVAVSVTTDRIEIGLVAPGALARVPRWTEEQLDHIRKCPAPGVFADPLGYELPACSNLDLHRRDVFEFADETVSSFLSQFPSPFTGPAIRDFGQLCRPEMPALEGKSSVDVLEYFAEHDEEYAAVALAERDAVQPGIGEANCSPESIKLRMLLGMMDEYHHIKRLDQDHASCWWAAPRHQFYLVGSALWPARVFMIWTGGRLRGRVSALVLDGASADKPVSLQDLPADDLIAVEYWPEEQERRIRECPIPGVFLDPMGHRIPHKAMYLVAIQADEQFTEAEKQEAREHRFYDFLDQIRR